MRKILLFLAILNLSFCFNVDLALGQEAETKVVELFSPPDSYIEQCSNMWCEIMKGFPELNAWLLAIFTFLGLILRATADLLAFVGAKIAHKNAGEWAKKLNSWALWAAQVIGWFGGGTPKAVMQKKIEEKLEPKQ